MPAITKASLRKTRVGVHTDKSLLRVLLFATGVISLAIILIPFTIDDDEPSGLLELPVQPQPSPTSKATTFISENANPLKPPVQIMKPNAEATIHELSNVGVPERMPRNKEADDTTQTTTKDVYHTVFSTGCSTFQDWQSYVFFYHLLHSGQEGPVTRIASGCSEGDANTLQDIFDKEIAGMAPGRFRLHFTPDFSKVKPGKTFKYFNKPCGMRHWMQEALGFPDNHEEHDDTMIILLDPDQILVRPFTNDFTNSSEKWRLKEGYHQLKVEHGSPFSQQYGYGVQWKRKVNSTQVFQGPSPVADMTDKEAMDYYYGMGPPYIATGKDMYTIVSKWAEIVPRVHNDYPHLLAEMFAFNLAAAHHGLRFTIAHSFMVSDVYAGGEGWKLIDQVPRKDICHHFPKSEYPHVIHYCQRYYLGKWFIGKYKLRKDFISCESPLLLMPPEDLAIHGYTSAVLPDGSKKDIDLHHSMEQAFMVCTMIRALNDAALYYKDHHCDRATANYDYSYTFHRDMTMPEDASV